MTVRKGALLLCLGIAVLAAAQPAEASYLLGRNAKSVTLKVNRKGIALVTYRDARGWHRVLAWGAVNALPPTTSRPQVKFKLDYSGGSGSFGANYWRTFRDASRPYDGPQLAWLVAARRAPDGSYWALQKWQRLLPNWGYKPWNPARRAWELRLSHWTGEPATLELWPDWVTDGRFHHLYGRLTYQGVPVYGFGNTSSGVPTDTYGRNVYLDTYNSAYGDGWERENSFLTHRPNGNFCYGFYRHKGYDGRIRPEGNGQRFRATVIGPGVTPDAYWAGAGLPDYNPSNPEHVQYERDMNALGDSLIANDPTDPCTRH